MNNKIFIIVTCILALAAAVSITSYLPARTDIALKIKVADFPKAVGDWTGTDMPIDELTYRILETRNLFIREYKNPEGEKIYFYIVYSEDNRKVSHPPEVCFMGSGATIAERSKVQITDSIKATRMVTEMVDSRQLVVYWYKAGSLSTNKYLKQQLKIAMERMLGKRTSGALIRVSTDIKGDEQDSAVGLVKSFCVQIEPLLAKYIP